MELLRLLASGWCGSGTRWLIGSAGGGAIAELDKIALRVGYGPMNPEKQHRKLEKLQLKAEECLSRKEAQKILRKADKAHRKLSEGLDG